MFLKKLSLLLLMITTQITLLMAQTKNDYSINWKKVEAFEKKGLTKSALEEVLKIYSLAVKDNNDAQQIKSCMYQIRYRNMVEEDSRENNIFFVDTLIAKAKAPAKNILQSMQAEMFWQYLQHNRYKFYNRTKLADEKSNDITTWSLDKLHATIGSLYKTSLTNDRLQKETTLDNFDPIIVKGENTRNLRTSLFDFLAHRALEYYMNDEQDLTKPAYSFTINDPAIFAPAAQFVNATFETKDTASLQHKAITLLQQILKFHLADANTDALLDADLIRLNFANQYAINEDKNALYEAALKSVEAGYKGNAGIAQARYLRASLYFSKGQTFQPFVKTDNQYEIKRAKDICDETIATFPKTEGAINCHNLLSQILQPSLNLETERVNIPDQPFRTLVKYKNAKTIYFRIIKTSREEIAKLDRSDYEKIWRQVTALKSIRNWNVAMPDPQDYQQHAAEIKVESLPGGTYFILASLDGNFSMQKNIIARQLIYVSNISYVHNNNNDYNVLNRDNGQPLPNTKVQVWQTKYNYNTSRNDEIKAEQYTTDKNGFFKLKQTKEYRSFLLQLINKNDELFMDDNNYNNYYNSYEQELKPVTFLFTDRSIYRPGQTLYFKGIVIKKSNKPAETAIMPGANATLILKDVNRQKISELQLVTNEYGSYHGSFKLPEGSLNGQFSLEDQSTGSVHYFNVEEYKRPKFFVEIQQPAGTYRLYDSIKVKGTAKAYAGNNIDGAKVSYRVVRKVRYPIWWGWGYRGRIMPPGRTSDEMEIANGTITTDAGGEFSVTFKALPDQSINKKDQPTFYYEVSADITDINGETRSGETSVAVAYQAIQLNIDIPEKIHADSLKNIKIRSTNINDIFEKATVNVTIHKLQSPNKMFRERFWEMPDQFTMSKDEYYEQFPYDVYKDEDQNSKWPVGEKVQDKTDTTSINGQWPAAMVNNSLAPGWYKIVAVTKDKYGEEARAEKFLMIQGSDKDKSVGVPADPVTVTVQQNQAEPGQQFNYSIKTGFDNTWLIHTLSRMDKTNNSTYLAVKQSSPYQNQIQVTETDRGGMSVSYVFVQHNRVYKGEAFLAVPWNNKNLSISYQTFRDKILPGSEEKWTAKITGSKGEKVAAEMLVSMYDASLDQFKYQGWNPFNIWPGLSNRVSWMANGFATVNSEEFSNWPYDYISVANKIYDRLLAIFLDNGFGRGNAVLANSRIRTMESADQLLRSAPSVALEAGISTEAASKQYKLSKPALEKDGDGNADSIDLEANSKPATENPSVQIRKNFNETAFFFPDLTTDEAGNVSFSFTIPEALTKWKLMTFAHSKQLASGYTENTVLTQKPLMVQPNAPRFMREGDRMELSAKIVNLSEKEITGTAQLELLDAATNKPIDGWFKNVFPNQYFTVAAGQSQAVKFPMEIPFNFNSALTYRITAKSTNNSPSGDGGGSFSDGEEAAFPILTNRMLVTETMPLNLRNTNTKDFKFEKLLNSDKSSSLINHAVTVEFTANPAWYAVQALPYLMEYPYDCAEQTFNRYYANTLAAHVSNSMPKIKAVFEKWKIADTAALMSNLEKNEELKSALLQETPWVLDAQNENQQKKNIALLFDMVKLGSESAKAINKLKELQSPNGGFVWFKGGADDRYMTQYIITGIGHLRKLNALPDAGYKMVKTIVDQAIPYLDKKIQADYDYLIKNKAVLKNNQLSNTAIQYLYMRSFFTEYAIPVTSRAAYDYYLGQAKKYWLSNGKYQQAMIALILHRTGGDIMAKAIIKSLKENAINKEEMGMYWKEWTTGGYFWYQAPIESQAMMIEAFTDIDKNAGTINDLKTWLLKQKQTQNWKTTRATAEACYALLYSPAGKDNWLLSQDAAVTITLGSTVINSISEETSAGSGYFKKRIDGGKVKSAMGNISVKIQPADSRFPPSGGGGAWGSVYWQYFEDLDKITMAATPLSLQKKLFVEKNTDKGPVLQPVTDGPTLKVGDKIKVRIELKVDRDMEYVHMKDMRGACMEPVNVISGYKYQGGLGYYESTKDASTNFFFGWLARGSYVFEYPVFVTHAGNFSNGITTIQCMYAPEFTSHSEGVRVSVEAQ